MRIFSINANALCLQKDYVVKPVLEQQAAHPVIMSSYVPNTGKGPA